MARGQARRDGKHALSATVASSLAHRRTTAPDAQTLPDHLRCLLAGLGVTAEAQKTADQFRPEIDTYVNLIRQQTICSCVLQESSGCQLLAGQFRAHLDVALKPIFRRDLRRRDDVFQPSGSFPFGLAIDI